MLHPPPHQLAFLAAAPPATTRRVVAAARRLLCAAVLRGVVILMLLASGDCAGVGGPWPAEPFDTTLLASAHVGPSLGEANVLQLSISAAVKLFENRFDPEEALEAEIADIESTDTENTDTENTAIGGEAAADEADDDAADDDDEADDEDPQAAAVELDECSRLCDLWLISTRSTCSLELKQPCVSHFVSGQGWQTSSLTDFLAGDDPQVVTFIMVHGNDNDPVTALRQGSQFFRRMCRPECGNQPRMRFVIWSWPSTFVPGAYRRDLRLKAARVDPQAVLLAQFLTQLRPDLPVSLAGYSFGVPIITGAIHLVAGGRLCGRTVADPHLGNRQPYRVATIAAAMSNCALAPGNRNGQAMQMIAKLTVFMNPCDFILRLYPKMHANRGRWCGPAAMGVTGPCGITRHGEYRERITLYNTSCEMGRKHRLKYYLQLGGVMGAVRRDLVVEALPTQTLVDSGEAVLQ